MISQFLVPSAELEMYRGNLKMVRLVESINEPWSWSTPLDVDAIPPQLQLPSLSKVLPTPQPDYAVGFPHDAFTPVQLEKLKPYLGSDKQEQDEVFKTSVFQGTQGMLFPFLTSECKSFTGKPFVANRQNAHSMGRSLRGVVELFRLSRRQTELHRKVLGFSIYHDHRTVTINAHYMVLEAGKSRYYQKLFWEFLIRSQTAAERWGTYNFVTVVYHDWAPRHFARLSSAIDMIPDANAHMDDASTAQAAVLKQRMVSEPEEDIRSVSDDTPVPPTKRRRRVKARR